MKSCLRHLFCCAIFVAVFCSLVANKVHAQVPAGGVGPNYETRLATLEDTMRALNGQLEQLGYAVRRIDQSLQRMQGDYDTRLTRLETAQANMAASASQPTTPSQTPPSATPSNIAATSTPPDTTPNGTLGAVKMQDGRVIGGVNNPQSPPLPETPPDYGLSTQEQYDRAFGLLRQADYENAEKAFKAFIEKNPKDKLIDNAKYWYGETLYVRGRYDEAAVAFADAYQQNQQSTKAPDCLLKLAKSLSAIDKVPDACTTLLELKNRYPNASATVRSLAEEERQKLKCGSH